MALRSSADLRGNRPARVLAAGAALVLAVCFLAEPAASALPTSAGRSRAARASTGLVVTPATGITDGQLVSLSFSEPLAVTGVDLCVAGQSPAAGGTCGPATATSFFAGTLDPEIGLGISTSPSGSATAVALDAAFRDPAGNLVDCRLQPGSRCDVVLLAWDSATRHPIDGPRAGATFDATAPLRPPMTLGVSAAGALRDAQTVSVALTHVKANVLSVVECSQRAATTADSVKFCESGIKTTLQADASGNASGQVTLSALLETPDGLVDCRTRTGDDACVLETGDQLTGPLTQALSFDADAPLNDLGPRVFLRPGASPRPSNGWTQTIDLAGFTPSATATLTWCNAKTCDRTAITSGTVAANGTVAGLKLPNPLPPPATSLACSPASPCHVQVADDHGVSTSLPNTTNVGSGPDSLAQSENLPITISPVSDLADGQQVLVSGLGFSPNTGLEMVECTQDVATHGLAACDPLTARIGIGIGPQTGTDGRFAAATFTVRTSLDIGGDRVDCTTGNVDPVEFWLHNLAGDPRGVLGQPSYHTCVLVVTEIGSTLAHSGFGAIAFTGETFTPFPGDATPHQLGVQPLAAPCGRVAGSPRFVRLLLLRFVGRCPSPQELAWLNTSARSGATTASVAFQVARSPAALTVTLDRLYERVLGREVDSSGLGFWGPVLASTQRPDLVTTGLATSREFLAAHPSPELWITGLYETILGRAAGTAEVAYWTGLLHRGWSPSQVILEIADSRESGIAEIGRAYQQVLHRPADAAGVSYWLSELNPSEQLFTLRCGLAASAEFASTAQAQPST